MLVLSRKKTERIVIGDNITIEIVDIRNDNVRLGIHAPRDVSIHRQEIYDLIRAEWELNKDEAADTDAADGSILGDG